MKIEIDNVSEEEYKAILQALDLYNRTLSGQTKIISETLGYNGLYAKDHNESDAIAIRLAGNHFNGIDGICSSLGISNACINAKRAYNLYVGLRYESGMEGAHSVYRHKLYPLIKSDITIKITQ